VHLAEIEEYVGLIGMQVDGNAMVSNVVGAAQVVQAGERIAPGDDGAAVLEGKAVP